MNRTAIKNFATRARRSLREQVRTRAIQFGISANEIQEAQEVSGGLVVAGQALNADEAEQYRLLQLHLQDLMRLHKQAQAVEMLIDEIAYTWFNRVAALRFMEVNGYLTTRVLSSSDPKLVDPDMLRDAGYIAEAGEFPGLNLEKLDEWRDLASRAPNPEEWLYRRLLVAQCEALADGLPFLFDRSKNYTALFVPANLLNQDSIVRRLVTEIPEEDWRDSSDSENGVEIIGWLYQFYISERKDEVIGAKSKVAAQDIPAATQLFTPHWIVRYMVENSLGRLWLESHPESQLRSKMPYYLESPDSSTHPPTHPSTLQPQDLTVCDPACGSGHILVYAFDLLFEIYREQGYLERDIPGLILTHNLFGLDIDERAAQLASFAVLMKARAKNSRILRRPPTLNITTVRSTRQLSLPNVPDLKPQDWQALLEAFKDAEHLGSLITPPMLDGAKLREQVEAMEQNSPLFQEYGKDLRGLILQAELLQRSYWVVVANPPYMGDKSFNDVVKDFTNKHYLSGKGDLYGCYILRNLELCCESGFTSMITRSNWMFISSYKDLRKNIIKSQFLLSLIHIGRGVWGSDHGSCSFSIKKIPSTNYLGIYKRLFEKAGSVLSNDELEKKFFETQFFYKEPKTFLKIRGCPFAYWATEKLQNVFQNNAPLEEFATPCQGLSTGKTDRFIRYWFEVRVQDINFIASSNTEAQEAHHKWFPIDKGGEYRKWYGNNDSIINWHRGGQEIKSLKPKSVIRNEEKYFQPGITWGKVTIGAFSARKTEAGFLFSDAGMKIFASSQQILDSLILFLNSNVAEKLLSCLSDTINFEKGDIERIPVRIQAIPNDLLQIVSISELDWNRSEEAWDFQTHILICNYKNYQLSKAFASWNATSKETFQKIKQLEEENNRYWIEAYGLQDELTPEFPDEQITLRRADLSCDICSLISYAVGCMMGRYSLDKPGLIHAGQPFDPSQHTTFPADVDAILPITDQAYFDDDIVSRFIEFIKTTYGETHLKENLDFIAQALTLQSGESAQDRIRRYFLTEFISNHIQIYKKRPIYWLFTSGKNRAFGALVYLHRYTPNTVGQIRTDYVLELQRKLPGEIDRTQKQLDTATTSAAKKTIQRRLKTLRDQDAELAAYQAKLQTVADQRIELDLDDGVAYNYTRFKGLVYEGSDLKMADLEKKAQWKLDLLRQ